MYIMRLRGDERSIVFKKKRQLKTLLQAVLNTREKCECYSVLWLENYRMNDRDMLFLQLHVADI